MSRPPSHRLRHRDRPRTHAAPARSTSDAGDSHDVGDSNQDQVVVESPPTPGSTTEGNPFFESFAGKTIDIVLEANGFLYNMVRNIVGTLIEVGKGSRSPDSLPALFASRDRTQAGFTAPPQGLALLHVAYPPETLFTSETEESVEQG